MGKMSIGIWSQRLLFLLLFLIFVVVLSVKPPREYTFGGGRWLEFPKPCIIPDGELSDYKSLPCPPKSIHSSCLPYG